jgi:Big-like domain-containing protein
MPRLMTYLAALVGLALAAPGCRDGASPTFAAPGDSIWVVQPAFSLSVGEQAQVQGMVIRRNGHREDLRLFFRSDDPGVAAVDSTGTVTALADGHANIVVFRSTMKTTVPVQVRDPRYEIAGFRLSYSLPVLKTSDVTAGYAFFSAEAADGSDLCGHVTPALRTDPAILTATYNPSIGNGCMITLVPVAVGTTWLVAQADTFRDSVEVTVIRERYHWELVDLDQPLWPKDERLTVGTPARYEFWAVDEEGRPVSGLRLHFRAAPGVLSDSAPVTDSTGAARVSWTATEIPRMHFMSSVGYDWWVMRWYFGLMTDASISVSGTWPDGTAFSVEDSRALRPAEPATIALFTAYHLWGFGCGMSEVRGDTAWIGAASRPGSGFVCTYDVYSNWKESIWIGVLDRYGNPVTEDWPLPQAETVADGSYALAGGSVLTLQGVGGSWGYPWPVMNYLLDRKGGAQALRLTVSVPGYPAVPPRTVTVLPVPPPPSPW